MMKPIVFVSDPLVIKEMVTDFKMFPRIGDKRGFIDRLLLQSVAIAASLRQNSL
jgi:hypothetical protein